MIEYDMAGIRARYKAAREQFTATQHDLYQHVARMGDVQFRELLDRSQAHREAWEDALADYLTALVLVRHGDDMRLARENRERLDALDARPIPVAGLADVVQGLAGRLDALERWAYGTGRTPPPGHDDPDDYTGRG